MATQGLAIVGNVIGSVFGGPVGGAFGTFAGAYLGSHIDRAIGLGPEPVNNVGPRLTEIGVQTSAEGAPIKRVFGKAKIPGHVIWMSRFTETAHTTSSGGSGKGAASAPETRSTEYIYSCSFAIGFTEGPIVDFLRIWVDGQLLDLAGLTYRVYLGTETQDPDATIVAIEGAEYTPAFKGLAYIVFEDMPLTRYGNRIPNVTAEVFAYASRDEVELEYSMTAVNIIPATGEHVYNPEKITTIAAVPNTAIYAYNSGWAIETDGSSEFVRVDTNRIQTKRVNANNGTGVSDWTYSMDQLQTQLPNIGKCQLVCSWFGDDLRLDQCKIRPKVEFYGATSRDPSQRWQVSGLERGNLDTAQVSLDAGGNPYFGGTPSDVSIYNSLRDLNDRGIDTAFYPFILMDIPPGNTLPNPYSNNAATVGQPTFPWRGRITISPAPGYTGTPDKTGSAASAVNTFFGACASSDFGSWTGTTIPYTGPNEFSYRRFILHYAHLCAAAGGVDLFYIGTEMVNLMNTRSATSTYPAVTAMKTLAAEVSAILGPSTKITYAADWSEWNGHQANDSSGDFHFHLDPIWADTNIDLVAIDNYMPLSDWRDGQLHLDRLNYDSIYDVDYLKSQIEGGEGYDYYYASMNDRLNQTRTPITDGAPAGYGSAHSAREDSDTDASIIVPNVVPISGLHKMLIVTVSWEATGTKDISSITWNGANLTRIHLTRNVVSGAENVIASYYLLNASYSASTSDIIITFAGAIGNDVEVVVSQYFNAEQAAPSFQTYTGFASELSYSTTISAVADDGVIIAALSTGNSSTISSNPGQTDIHDLIDPEFELAVSYKALEGASKNVGFTWDNPLERGVFAAVYFNNIGYNKPWVFRRKDLYNWWSNEHYNRPNGAESVSATAWVPESKQIIFSELGCPAIDKGPNQPNVFYDPKSSESFFPYFSSGGRDDVIQRRFLEAHYTYWADTANNPISSVYSAPMLDNNSFYLWTWDARPFPYFPALTTVWRDSLNWELGHWITGRVGAVELKDLVASLVSNTGITYDTSTLNGLVFGYVIDQPMTIFEMLQQLAVTYFFDMYEDGDTLRFKQRASASVITLTQDDLIRLNNDGETFSKTRVEDNVLPRQVRVSFQDVGNDLQIGTTLAQRLVSNSKAIIDYELAIASTASNMQSVAEVLLYEALTERETITFSIKPRHLIITPADVITLTIDNESTLYRVLEVVHSEVIEITAVRTNPEIYNAVANVSLSSPIVTAAEPVQPLMAFLDIPLLRDVDANAYPAAPWIAAFATPWNAQAFFRSPETSDYQFDSYIQRRADIGNVLADVATGPEDVWDRGNTIRVAMAAGARQLLTITEAAALNRVNLAAAFTNSGEWEIFSWVTATLVDTGTWDLTQLLRGRFGTEKAMQSGIPAGAEFVLLDSVTRSKMPTSLRNVLLNWKFGPTNRDISDDTYVTVSTAIEGLGLRPYSVANIEAAQRITNNDVIISWVRRSRLPDSASDWEAPLDESIERYEIDIFDTDETTILRTIVINDTNTYTYTAASQTTDFGGVISSLTVEIFQMSLTFGRGVGRKITIDSFKVIV